MASQSENRGSEIDVQAYLNTMAGPFGQFAKATLKLIKELSRHLQTVKGHPLYDKSEEAWRIIQEVYDIRPSDLESIKIITAVYGAAGKRENDD